MSIFKCDYKKKNSICSKKPYMEIYPFEKNDEGKWESMHSWCYLCFKHYLIMRFQRLFGRVKFSCCRADNLRESIEDNKEMIWGIQSDLYEIKDKLGIEMEIIPELEELLDKKKKDKENKGYV